MICPFRVDVEFEYTAIVDKKGEDPQYLEKAQRQVYAKCMGHDCPFYEYGGTCNRVEVNE